MEVDHEKFNIKMGWLCIVLCGLFTWWFWWLDMSTVFMVILKLIGWFFGVFMIFLLLGFYMMTVEKDWKQ